MAVYTSAGVDVTALSKAHADSAYQHAYREGIKAVFEKLLTNYSANVLTTDDADTQLKGLQFYSKALGLEPEKKQDTGPVLQTVVVNIGGARSPVITEKMVQNIDDVQDKLDVVAVPSELMRANLYINGEVVDDAA